MTLKAPAAALFRCAVTAGVVLAATALLPSPAARAQSYANTHEEAKIMIHAVPVAQAGGRPCNSSKALAPCDQMKVAGNLSEPYYAFVCITDANSGPGIAGLQFSVKYSFARNVGVDITEWVNCATLEFPFPNKENWYKNASGGNLITWAADVNCQRYEPSGAGTGVTAVAGYFYLTAYTPDRLEIVPRSVDGWAKVADCNSGETLIAGPGAPIRTRPYLGWVEFSDGAVTAGHNPCGLAKVVVPSSWSGVKQSGGSQ
jgi:hypothetical protein